MYREAPEVRGLCAGKYLPCGGQDLEHGRDSQEREAVVRSTAGPALRSGERVGPAPAGTFRPRDKTRLAPGRSQRTL